MEIIAADEFRPSLLTKRLGAVASICVKSCIALSSKKVPETADSIIGTF